MPFPPPSTVRSWIRTGSFVLAAFGLLALSFVDAFFGSRWWGLALVVWWLLGWRQGISAAHAVLAPALVWLLLPEARGLAVAGVLAAVILALERWRDHQAEHDRALLPLRLNVFNAVAQQKLLQRHVRRFPLLQDLCSGLFTAQERGQLASTIADHVRELIPQVTLVHIGLCEDESPEFTHGQELPTELLASKSFVLREQRLLVHRQEDHVAALVPLRGDRRRNHGEQELRGVLVVGFPALGFEDHLMVDILSALGRMAGLSLASVRLLEQARSLALHDDLTGLFGQHEFLRRLEEQASEARRAGRNLALVMCDMDHLKAFNDQYGHPAGDQALRAIAERIKHVMPEQAIACRYGGEEFALAIPGLTDASDLTEHLRLAIEQVLLPDQARVTASLGWSCLQAEEAPRQALERADQACYRAKHLGRNRVEVAS